MTSPEPMAYLLDLNLVIALVTEDHMHHSAAMEWFDTPELIWALCAFTEAGLLRFLTHPKIRNLPMDEGVAILTSLKGQPGCQYVPVIADWHQTTAQFAARLHGHNQITDAFLLGIAIREGFILATFDRAFLHLAGEHRQHVHVLKGNAARA
jgi:toxin-antitoxin system PIN domain toxin